MRKRRKLNRYQVGRAGWEKKCKSEFSNVINKLLREKGYNIEFQEIEEPDYEIKKEREVIAYFEAEFPLFDRWHPGKDFKYPTIRWPKRKYDYYGQWNGWYNEKPLFMITIRGDLTDAYYIDAKTWFEKGREERAFTFVFYGINKNDPELGHGLEELADYMFTRIKAVYKIQI